MTSKRSALLVGLALVAVSSLLISTIPAEADLDPEATADPAHLVEGCTDATDATVMILPGLADRFHPNCVVVENGQAITWENRDRAPHDPGDGIEDARERALCFQGAVDIQDERNLPPGETYSIQLRFDEARETLVLEKAWHNGERQDLNGPDEGLGTIECNDHAWERLESGVLAISYICHIHPHSSGRILLEV